MGEVDHLLKCMVQESLGVGLGRVCIYMYVYTRMHIYMHTCIHTYMYIYICIYMYVYGAY